jgi:hypothetical protein
MWSDPSARELTTFGDGKGNVVIVAAANVTNVHHDNRV